MAGVIIGVTIEKYTNQSGTLRWAVNEAYTRAIIQAGGIPLLLANGLPRPALENLCSRVDGILLTGGGDVETARYGGEEHPSIGHPDPARDETEITLAQICAQQKIPLMAICRGAQVLNIALGGTLYSHIPAQFSSSIEHDCHALDNARTHLAHTVHLQPGCLLHQVVGETILPVNSLHHQGLQRLGVGVQPVAWAPDGLVEAVELTGHPFFIGVQWHPEWLTDQPATQALIASFVKAAQFRE
jgi:putative glutamine amidotransferase